MLSQSFVELLEIVFFAIKKSKYSQSNHQINERRYYTVWKVRSNVSSTNY